MVFVKELFDEDSYRTKDNKPLILLVRASNGRLKAHNRHSDRPMQKGLVNSEPCQVSLDNNVASDSNSNNNN